MKLDKSVFVTAKTPLEGKKIWTYLVTDEELPNEEFPISQTYVDVVLTGCFDIGEEWVQEFLHHTDGWVKHWVEDREKYSHFVKHHRQYFKEIEKALEIIMRMNGEAIGNRRQYKIGDIKPYPNKSPSSQEKNAQ